MELDVFSRRKVLNWLVALPFMGRATAQPSEVSLYITESNNIVHPGWALSIVRILNTAEARHFRDHGLYASRNDLLRSGVLPKIPESSDSLYSSKVGRGAIQLYKLMDLRSTYVLPGWTLQIHVPAQKDRYLLTMLSGAEQGRAAFASDEIGVIYHGRVESGIESLKSYAPLDKVLSLGLAPLRLPEARRGALRGVAAFVRQAAFFTTTTQANPDVLCHCSGSCSDSSQPGCCNTGYAGCAWCCFSNCSTCNAFCVFNCGDGHCIDC